MENHINNSNIIDLTLYREKSPPTSSISEELKTAIENLIQRLKNATPLPKTK